MSRVVLSIGSNLGNSLEYLQQVVTNLGSDLVQASSIYRTKPWGFTEQADFLNAVLIADKATYSVEDWLRFAREQEQQAARVRNFRYGPRTLDVDIIAATEDNKPIFSTTPELVLPHPRALQRLFVIIPWLEIAPTAMWVDAEHPQGFPVQQVLQNFSLAELQEVILTDLAWQ